MSDINVIIEPINSSNIIIEPINYKVQVSNFSPSNSNNVNFNTGDLTGAFAQLYADNILTGNNTFTNNVVISGAADSFLGYTNLTIADDGVAAVIQFTDNGGGNYILDNNSNAILFVTTNTGQIQNRELSDEFNSKAISFTSSERYLFNNLANVVLDYNSGLLYDEIENLSVDWINRYLYDESGIISLDWQNRILSGNWSLPSANTGELTGIFYPLNSNPNSYITPSQTGGFVTTGQTGAFGGNSFDTGILNNYANLNENNNFTTGSLNIYNGNGRNGPNAIIIGSPMYDNFNNLWGAGIQFSGTVALFDTSGIYILTTDAGQRELYDQNGNESINFNDKFLIGSESITLEWGTYSLINSSGFASVDWNNLLLYSNYNSERDVSLDWKNRLLVDTGQNTIIDWQNRILTGGSWTIQSGAFTSPISFTNVPSGTPTNIITPADWMPVFVSGQKYFIPLYQ